MSATKSESSSQKNRSTVERKSDRELVVTRTFNSPAHLVFEAWTKAEFFQQWWVPKSLGLTLLSCELDVRVGGRYKLVFSHNGMNMEFFGTYTEVTPHSRLVWTNDESEGAGPVTSVTFEEKDGKTLVTVCDLYPSKEALEAGLASGSMDGLPESLDQLDEFLTSSPS